MENKIISRHQGSSKTEKKKKAKLGKGSRSSSDSWLGLLSAWCIGQAFYVIMEPGDVGNMQVARQRVGI